MVISDEWHDGKGKVDLGQNAGADRYVRFHRLELGRCETIRLVQDLVKNSDAEDRDDGDEVVGARIIACDS